MNDVCSICGMPLDICKCKERVKEEQKIKVYVESRKFKKPVTVIKGFDSQVDVGALAKKLKVFHACGGTVRNSKQGQQIELQGDHRKSIKSSLINFGFTDESVDVE